MRWKTILLLWILAVAGSGLNAQVVFSRRVYRESGQTYQQIWNWDPASGKMTQLTKSERPHFQPRCSADGKQIRFLSGNDVYQSPSLWDFDRQAGAENKISDKAEVRPAEVKIADARAKKLVSTHPSGAESAFLGWSPNGKYLLISTRGESDNSTSRQSDFFILDAARSEWIAAGSGNDAMWVPGRNEIVYSTPRDLSEVGKRSVWTAHLVRFDPATRKAAPITSGVTNNVQPSACVSSTSRGNT